MASSIDEKRARVPAEVSTRLRSLIKPRGPERGRAGGSEKPGVARPFDIHAEIFELAAPVERELHLNAAADGPAHAVLAQETAAKTGTPRA